MNWWLVWIGAALGWVFGGPVGAIIGAFLGYQLGGANIGMRVDPQRTQRAQAAFFTATFSVMGHVAKADGHVSENEIRAARSVMAHMNLDTAQQQAAIDLFNRGKQPDFALDDVLARFRIDCGGRFDLLSMFMEIQLHAALADGPMQPAERRLLEHICVVLGFSPQQLWRLEQFIQAQQAYRGARPAHAQQDRLTAAYQTLGVSPEATPAEIKQAYRRLMKDNHPDKLVARGLPEQMIRLAQEKVQQINVAYDAIKAARGIK